MNGRNLFYRAGAFAVLLTVASGAFAQAAWPTKPIRLVVPAAAGGSTDIGARLVARLIAADLGQPVIVENKAGGGGRIGATEVARATPDGYTLVYANSITHALLPATSKSVQYDPLKSFAPVGGTFWYSTLVVCNASVPFNNLAGFIDYARKNPGRLNMATAGLGSGNHFSSELLASMAGIKVTHVPYKGNGPAIQDVIGSLADCMHLGEAKSFLDAGKLKAIGTTGKYRDPRYPSVPTIEEEGLKGFDVTWWQGIFAPAGTPPRVLERLSRAVRKTAEDPSVKTAMFDAGFVPQYVPPAQLTIRVSSDMAKFRKIARDAGLDLE